MRIALAHNLKRSCAEEEAEFDTAESIAAMAGVLAGLGHEVECVEVSCPVPDLVARLQCLRPDLVFNLAEGRVGTYREAFYPALYEQLGLPYTGSDAGTLALALDKATTKKVLAGCPGIRLPRSALFRAAPADGCLEGLAYPVLIKPNFEGSSKGISQRSVVAEGRLLPAVVADLLRRYPAGVLVEEYIDGLDVSVPFVEGLSPETGGVLAPVSYRYPPTGTYRLYDLHLKHEADDLVETEVPAALDGPTIARLVGLARAIVGELDVLGYGRSDFRVDAAGAVYFLEVNPLPDLAIGPDAEFYKAAALLGRSVADVIACIVGTAARRFGLPGAAGGREVTS